MGLNKKNIVYFTFAKTDGNMKLMHGDKLKLKYMEELHKVWVKIGHVNKILYNYGEKIN